MVRDNGVGVIGWMVVGVVGRVSTRLQGAWGEELRVEGKRVGSSEVE